MKLVVTIIGIVIVILIIFFLVFFLKSTILCQELKSLQYLFGHPSDILPPDNLHQEGRGQVNTLVMGQHYLQGPANKQHTY